MVVEFPTHLKNMLVKLDIFLKMGGENEKIHWNPSFAGFPKCSAFKFEESIANFHGQEDQKISCSVPFRTAAFYREICRESLRWQERKGDKNIQPGISWPFGHGSFILKRLPRGMNECHLKKDHSKSKIVFQPSFFRGYVSFQGSITFQLWMTWWNSSLTHHRLWQEKRWICLEYPYRKALLITNLFDLFHCGSCFNPPKFLKSQTIWEVQEKNYVANLDHFQYLLSLFIPQKFTNFAILSTNFTEAKFPRMREEFPISALP